MTLKPINTRPSPANARPQLFTLSCLENISINTPTAVNAIKSVST